MNSSSSAPQPPPSFFAFWREHFFDHQVFHPEFYPIVDEEDARLISAAQHSWRRSRMLLVSAVGVEGLAVVCAIPPPAPFSILAYTFCSVVLARAAQRATKEVISSAAAYRARHADEAAFQRQLAATRKAKEEARHAPAVAVGEIAVERLGQKRDAAKLEAEAEKYRPVDPKAKKLEEAESKATQQEAKDAVLALYERKRREAVAGLDPNSDEYKRRWVRWSRLIEEEQER